MCLEVEGSLPPYRQGPPLHIHHLEDEEGRVISGVLSARIDGRRITVGPGETVRLPRGSRHRWWNDGGEPLRFEGVVLPVIDLDRYLHAIFEIVNASPLGRSSLFYLAHVLVRHGRTQAVPILPAPIQQLLMHLLVAVGTVLGRYRGTDWPGCPDRCTGAALGDNAAQTKFAASSVLPVPV